VFLKLLIAREYISRIVLLVFYFGIIVIIKVELELNLSVFLEVGSYNIDLNKIIREFLRVNVKIYIAVLEE